MNNLLYVKNSRLYATDYCEIYIPQEYTIDDRIAINKGSSYETFGILYIRGYKDGKEGPVQLLNIPVVIDIMIHEMEEEEIKINGKYMPVITLKYMKDSHVMNQMVQKGRHLAELFLNLMLNGKLPKSIDYQKIIDIWWKNLEIAGVDYKVPSKILELIIANIYRNPHNMNQRFGEFYGKQTSPDGYNYKTGNVRNIVERLSTFSGMVFEDMGNMITTGINNSNNGIEEPVSPIEKIMYY